MFLVASSPSGCCTENPLQTQLCILQMNDSSQMWSMKWSLLVFVYIKLLSCLMIQNPKQICHLLQQIIISPHAPLLWGVMSGPAAPSTHEAGSSFLTVWAQKCDTQSESSSGMSWVPPFTSLVQSAPHYKYWGQLSHTRNTKTEIFALGAAITPPKRFRNQNFVKLTC